MSSEREPVPSKAPNRKMERPPKLSLTELGSTINCAATRNEVRVMVKADLADSRTGRERMNTKNVTTLSMDVLRGIRESHTESLLCLAFDSESDLITLAGSFS